MKTRNNSYRSLLYQGRKVCQVSKLFRYCWRIYDIIKFWSYFQQNCLEISLALRLWNNNLLAHCRWHFKHWRLMRSIEIHIFGENQRFQSCGQNGKFSKNLILVASQIRRNWRKHLKNCSIVLKCPSESRYKVTCLFEVPNLLTVAIISEQNSPR